MINKTSMVVFSSLAVTVCAGARPNVVMILTDDQGWGDLSCNGNTNLNTPNIDSLADQGAVFDRFYVSPVCSPTRAEVLTGRYHQHSGVYSTEEGGERIDLDEKTIADAFKTGGYATGAFGKWHNGMQAPYHPNSRGFQEFYGFCSGHWGNYFSPILEHNGEIVKGNGFIVDDLTDRALSFIEDNKDEPFFAYIPYNTPHSPMQVPDSYWEKFKDHPLPLRAERGEEKLNKTRAALAMCENIDMNVGRILKKLDELQLDENTLVIYFSDNGANGDRWQGGMRGIKGDADEGGVRSPMIMRWPKTIPAGLKIPHISSGLDLMPTLLELCELEPPTTKKLNGYSLVSLIKGKEPVWKNRVIVNSWLKNYGARSQQYRLDPQGRLYDMVKDPNQYTDLAKQHPKVVARLNAEIKKYKQSYSMPEVDERPFYITHESAKITQIPARDASWTGAIKRSGYWPNCSFLTGWTDQKDSITWKAEAGVAGKYQVDLYYTCPQGDEGSVVELSFNDAAVKCTIVEPHDPALKGAEQDRIPRGESYVKDFKRIDMGIIDLEKGKGTLTLKALSKPGQTVLDFRMITIKRVETFSLSNWFKNIFTTNEH